MDVQYRTASVSDIDRLLEMMEAYYRSEGIAFLKERSRVTLEQLLRSPAFGQVQLIDCDGAAIGYFCLTYSYTPENYGRDCCLDEIYIEPAFRNKGIGTHAIEFIEAQLRKEGFGSVYLLVYDHNPGAYSFYLRKGYRRQPASFMTKVFT